jgi:hypothetical protein
MFSAARVIFSVDMGLPSDADIKPEVLVSLASAISLTTGDHDSAATAVDKDVKGGAT